MIMCLDSILRPMGGKKNPTFLSFALPNQKIKLKKSVKKKKDLSDVL